MKPLPRRHKALIQLAAALATSSVAALLIKEFIFSPIPELRAILCQPIPSPLGKGRIQFMVIESTGTKTATDITVKVTYPRTVQPLDYRIESLDRPAEETRTDSFLRFTIARLRPTDVVLIAFAVGPNEITPQNIRVAHAEALMPTRSVAHLRLTDRYRH